MSTIDVALPPPPAAPPVGASGSSPFFPIELPPTRRLALGALAVGVLFDLALRSDVIGVAGALVVLAASVLLLASGRVVHADARVAVAIAPVFGVWLAIRVSPWLLPLDVLAAAGLLSVGAAFGRHGSLLDLPPLRFLTRACSSGVHGLLGLRFLRPLVPSIGRRGRGAAVSRGLLIAIPLVTTLALLLARADAVFASFFSFDLAAGTWSLHAVLIAVGTLGAAGLLRVASAAAPDDMKLGEIRLGATEATAVLGAIASLFGMFAIAQVYAATDAGDRVLRERGLTYADYARSGYFQLLWVVGLTIAGLLALRALTGGSAARRVAVLTNVVIALTLVIVGVAVHRLFLYEHAFGLTMLRLYCEVFAAWLGIVLALVGFRSAGLRPERAWLPAAIGASALGVLLVLNIANPEAVVARHNLQRTGAAAAAVDESYLADLSDDAVPTIVHLLPSLDATTLPRVAGAIDCGRPSHAKGWAAANLARAAADDARATICGVLLTSG